MSGNRRMHRLQDFRSVRKDPASGSCVLKGLGVIANHHQHGCGHDYCDFRKSIHAFVNDEKIKGLINQHINQ